MTESTTEEAYRCKDIERIAEEIDQRELGRFHQLYGILVDDNGGEPDGTVNLIPRKMVEKEDQAIFEKFSDIVEIRSIEIDCDAYDGVLQKLLDREDWLEWFYNQSYSNYLMMVRSPTADFIYEIAEGVDMLMGGAHTPIINLGGKE